jgi:hypothetical protein
VLLAYLVNYVTLIVLVFKHKFPKMFIIEKFCFLESVILKLIQKFQNGKIKDIT